MSQSVKYVLTEEDKRVVQEIDKEIEKTLSQIMKYLEKMTFAMAVVYWGRRKRLEAGIDALVSMQYVDQNSFENRAEFDTWRSACYRKMVKLRNMLITHDGVVNVAIAIFAFLTVVLMSYIFDVEKVIQQSLGIKEPLKMIVLGIAGAVMYFITEYIEEYHDDRGPEEIRYFTIRILMAIIFPLILVIILFDSEGNLSVSLQSEELLSFLCGFSAKLVTRILQKLVKTTETVLDSVIKS